MKDDFSRNHHKWGIISHGEILRGGNMLDTGDGAVTGLAILNIFDTFDVITAGRLTITTFKNKLDFWSNE